MNMSDQDKYTRNLVVKPRRKPVEVNPETEEAFEESKEMVKESVHQAVRTNRAFVTWLGIYLWRLVKHGFLFLTARFSQWRRGRQGTSSSPHAGQRRKTHTRPGKPGDLRKK
jgi:hypothetical protein